MQSAFAYSSCTILKAKYMEKVNTKPVTVNCVKIMQWIMVSCCTEIIVCDVNMSLLQPQAIAKQHQATWGGRPNLCIHIIYKSIPFLSLPHWPRQSYTQRNKQNPWNSADDQNTCIFTIFKGNSKSPDNAPEHPSWRTIAMDPGLLKPGYISAVISVLQTSLHLLFSPFRGHWHLLYLSSTSITGFFRLEIKAEGLCSGCPGSNLSHDCETSVSQSAN